MGGQTEEVGFGKPSLNQSGTKASAGRLPSPGGQRARREDESPGIVRRLCLRPRSEGRRAGLNSAALSRSGRAAHYHTAGLVNWAGPGEGSMGQGCGHSTAALRAGPPCPRHWDPSARSPCLSLRKHRRSQEAPTGRRVEEGNCGCPSPPEAQHQPPHPHHCSGKEIQVGRQSLPKATSRLYLCQHRATPARIALRKWLGGMRGGARSCRHPPGPVSTRGGMFLPPAGPPSACHPAHQARLNANPGAWWGVGALSTGSRRPPTHLHAHQTSISFYGSKGGSSTCKPRAQFIPGNQGDPPGVPTLLRAALAPWPS